MRFSFFCLMVCACALAAQPSLLALPPACPTDFNGDGVSDIDDLDDLSDAILQGGGNQLPLYDLDGNGVLDYYDTIEWTVCVGTVLGDVNLDGVFDESDLVEMFSHGEYEDGVAENSTYSEGDMNGDGEFDSSDLVLILQN